VEGNYPTGVIVPRQEMKEINKRLLRSEKLPSYDILIMRKLTRRHFLSAAPPANLNWNMCLGQAPKVNDIAKRCHGEFRWWYEYSGGKLTDWGAHHVDIAQWGIGMEVSRPQSIELIEATHPVPFEKGYPTVTDSYNTATDFKIRATFANGVEVIIRNNAKDEGFDSGVMFIGEKGRYFVNRGKITGAAVDELETNPLPENAILELRRGKEKQRHMANFIACVKDRSLPISDVHSHHRILTT